MSKIFNIEVKEFRPKLAEKDCYCDYCGLETKDLVRIEVSHKPSGTATQKHACVKCLGSIAGLTLLADYDDKPASAGRNKPSFKGRKDDDNA